MAGRECYHCKQWVEEGEAHDCWTTTEAALTGDLPDDLREAWGRFRESAAALGEQRIYASGTCIMFSRTACYCFVRPRRSFLEVCLFLGRGCARRRCAAPTAGRRPRSPTSCRSGIGTKSNRLSPTGFARRTDCRTCWRALSAVEGCPGDARQERPEACNG